MAWISRSTLFLLATILCEASAFAQQGGGVVQSGAVTVGDCVSWKSSNVIQDSGGACGGSSTITANSTATSGFTAGQILYSDGSKVQAGGPVIATSLALGGATIGSNALAVTGAAAISGTASSVGFIVGTDTHYIYDVSATTLGFRIGASGPYFNIRTVSASNMDFNNASSGSVTFSSGGTLLATISTGGLLTTSSATLMATSVALTNGAAAAAGTLTNAPVAGNPTKWIPISDNGTTRYIPAW